MQLTSRNDDKLRMMQKDKLRQDMFLIGLVFNTFKIRPWRKVLAAFVIDTNIFKHRPPGHLRRSIALKFAEL
jgi:hypothetical protein